MVAHNWNAHKIFHFLFPTDRIHLRYKITVHGTTAQFEMLGITLPLSQSLCLSRSHSPFEYRVPNFIVRIKSINFTNYNLNFYDPKWFSNSY